jgi:hypothetical protein
LVGGGVHEACDTVGNGLVDLSFGGRFEKGFWKVGFVTVLMACGLVFVVTEKRESEKSCGEYENDGRNGTHHAASTMPPLNVFPTFFGVLRGVL